MVTESEPSGWSIVNKAAADFLRYAADTFDLISITEDGARTLVRINSQLEKLAVEPEDGDDAMKERSKIAQREIDRGFALSHAHALMGVWGALEACIDDMCLGWLVTTKGEGAVDGMHGIKVALKEAYLLSGEPARSLWLLELLKRHQDAGLKPGIGQFESILGAIGVNGAPDPSLRSLLFRAKSMRNIIAHRGGLVDDKFLKECADIEAVSGEKLNVKRQHVWAGVTAMIIYVEDVRFRMKDTAGMDPEPAGLPPWVPSVDELVELFIEGEAAGGPPLT